MKEIITKIKNRLADYREDENNDSVRITEDCIERWINQFDVSSRIPILEELDNIFQKRYCSKKNAKQFIEATINTLAKKFTDNNVLDFLKNADFINIQPVGKSQGIMLKLLNDILEEKYNTTLDQCGSESKRYSIYMDDILCTGLTLISDTVEWSKLDFGNGKSNKDAIADNSTTLIFTYIFIHEKNYQKKVAEMRYKISSEIAAKHGMFYGVKVDNSMTITSKSDLIFPLQSDQEQLVYDYEKEVTAEVDEYTKRYNSTSPEEFYRLSNTPTNEEFFTSIENRKIIENAFLNKGITILKNSNVYNKNMRALGYSIPSSKNFGFGSLCFTWRNVPNNAPLVFWYSGGGFTPLFKVTRG